MPNALSSRQVVRQARPGRSYDSHLTKYFGAPATLGDGPQGFLVEISTPEAVIRPHFHRVNQFQVFVAGSGRMGKKPLEPIAVHYTDGFTPYGPIVADQDGVSFYTLRASADPGAQYMPGSRDKLERRARRSFTTPTGLIEGAPAPAPAAPALDDILPAHDDGLAAFTLRLPAGSALTGPAPAAGGGQYYIVVNGTLRFNESDLPERSLVFVDAGDDAPRLMAGAAGVEALVVQFPRAETTAS